MYTMYRAGKWLDQGRLSQRDMFGQGIGVSCWYRHIFGKGTIHCIANRPPVLAQITLPIATKWATTAEKRGIDRNPTANHKLLCTTAPLNSTSHGYHFASKFVSRHDRIWRRREFSLSNMQICTTNAARSHSNNQVFRSWCRIGDAPYANLSRLIDDYCTHA